MRHIAGGIAWAIFWALVIFGIVALIVEWHDIRPMLGLN